MRLEIEIKNQRNLIRNIYNDKNKVFNWNDMKQAIERLINMEILIEIERLKTSPDCLDEEV